MHLLDLYICSWDFDEAWYLSTYPDVEAAIRKRLFPSGWMHFRKVGYDQKKLLRTINAQAPKIMEQYKAKGVNFTVVVKDNQVIIRAKPKP